MSEERMSRDEQLRREKDRREQVRREEDRREQERREGERRQEDRRERERSPEDRRAEDRREGDRREEERRLEDRREEDRRRHPHWIPRFKVVIPARYASTRLPAKPLAEICGKPMIQHVWERAMESGAEDVVIATDHPEVLERAQGFGAHVLLTGSHHHTGTDRLAEVAQTLGWKEDQILVNVQGDEPLLPKGLIELTARSLAENPHCGISTLASPITHAGDLANPNIVKVVLREDHRALYFSRLPIPHLRDPHHQSAQELWDQAYFRHIGIYGYRVGTLLAFTEWEPCLIERMESLEQLRALYKGVEIYVAKIDQAPPHGVDTPEDLERVRKILAP